MKKLALLWIPGLLVALSRVYGADDSAPGAGQPATNAPASLAAATRPMEPAPAAVPATELQTPSEMWLSNDTVGNQSRLWFSGEYLLWWIKNGPNPPPLATIGSLADMKPGVLGQPGTTVILGDDRLDYHGSSGGRLSAGYWLDPERLWGIEASGFLLETRPLQQTVGSLANGSPPLFRPLNDATTGENSFFLAAPGFVAGSMVMSSTSQLWGVEANGVMTTFRGGGWQLIALAGYRHLNLDERIDVSTLTNDFGNFFGTGFLASPSNPGMFEKIGSTLAVTDSFRTRNQFDGGQVGAHAIYQGPGNFYLDLRGQVALGNTHQTIDIAGNTTQNQPGLPPVTFAAGVLAGQSNSGHFTHDQFGVVPGASVRLGYRWNEHWRAFVGYDFVYWSDVVRPGDQINRNVDFRSIPTSFAFMPGFQATRPAPPSFQQSGFWVQGVSFGLEFRY